MKINRTKILYSISSPPVLNLQIRTKFEEELITKKVLHGKKAVRRWKRKEI